VFASNDSLQFKTKEKNNKLAIFNNNNRQLTNYIFDKVYESPYIKPGHHYAGSITKFPYYGLILVKKDGQFAYLNEKCQEIVNYGTYDLIMPMNYYGYSMVKKNNKWGVIDKQCKLVAPLMYDLISQKPFLSYENAFKTFRVKINGKFRILDGEANWSLNLEFDSIQILFDNFYLGKIGEKSFLIDDNCTVLSDEYKSVTSIGDGFIVRKDRMMGVVDYQNKTMIPFIYDSINAPHLQSYFSACKNGKWGVIDLKGKTIIPFEYEQIERASEDLKDGEEDHLIVQKNKKLGSISLKNKVIIPIEYDGISNWVEYGPDAHYVKKDQLYGLINYFTGKLIIPVIYNGLVVHRTNCVEVKKNDLYGIVNYNNKEIIPCVYSKIYVDFDLWGFNKNHKDLIFAEKEANWYEFDSKGKLIVPNLPKSQMNKEVLYYKPDSNQYRYHLKDCMVFPK
jgi:hypothetical protein